MDGLLPAVEIQADRRAVRPQAGYPVYPLLERRYGVGICSIEQDIGACALPKTIAKQLSTSASAPALRVIHRMVAEGGEVFCCTVSLYPADRFRYAQARKRSEQGSGREYCACAMAVPAAPSAASLLTMAARCRLQIPRPSAVSRNNRMCFRSPTALHAQGCSQSLRETSDAKHSRSPYAVIHLDAPQNGRPVPK